MPDLLVATRDGGGTRVRGDVGVPAMEVIRAHDFDASLDGLRVTIAPEV